MPRSPCCALPTTIRDSRTAEIDEASEILRDACLRLKGQGLAVRTVVGHGEVADTIAAKANELDVDLIVMGAHGHGTLRRALEGSVPDRSATQERGAGAAGAGASPSPAATGGVGVGCPGVRQHDMADGAIETPAPRQPIGSVPRPRADTAHAPMSC